MVPPPASGSPGAAPVPRRWPSGETSCTVLRVREPAHAPALLCGLAGLLLGGSAVVPAREGSGPEVLVIRAAGYVDVEKGRVVRPAEVVVRGERILAVRSRTEPPAAGSRVLDL